MLTSVRSIVPVRAWYIYQGVGYCILHLTGSPEPVTRSKQQSHAFNIKSAGFLGLVGTTIMRMNKVYELTTNGVNAAIRDYIMNNWLQLSFRGIDKEKILEIESVELNIQTEFTQKGNYPFWGSARPQVCSDEGGYSTQN